MAALLAAAGAMAASASWGQAEVRTPLLGNTSGGDPGEWRCPRFAYLVGFEARNSDQSLHSISPICAEYRADGTRGALTHGPRFGGTAGDSFTRTCPESKPFIRSMRATTSVGSPLAGVHFACGSMTGPLAPTTLNESAFLLTGGIEGKHFLQIVDIVCPPQYGYAGIHARGGADLDAIGAICLPAVPLQRVASFGKKPIPEPPPIRNPSDTTTVLDRTAGPTFGQQSAAADAALPTRERPAAPIDNPVARNVAGRIDVNQIICRGGPSLGLQPVGPSETSTTPSNTWALYFTPARGPAKPDASGLEPGQCGYVDRPWTMGDPPGIAFDVAASAAGSADPRQYLSDSEHYWSFSVANNGRGMFVASRNGKYLDSQAPPAAETIEKPRCEGALVGMRNDLDSRIDRIRCEHAGLTANQRAQLNARLDEVLRWIAMAR
jgi:hypothetical protein